jgi:hypothetical protein
MIYVFKLNHVIVVFDGECSAPSSFEINSSLSQIHLRGVGPDKDTVTLTLDEDRLYVPVSIVGDGVRETFTRTGLEFVIQRHPCVGEFVAAS